MESKIVNHKLSGKLDSRLLFRFSSDIYQQWMIDPSLSELIENLTPDRYSFFILSGNKFLYPGNFTVVSPQKIWEAIGNNKVGVFRRQINNVTRIGELVEYTVCVTYIGLDGFKQKIAIGLICPADWRECQEKEERFYQVASQIRRFYDEFSSSSIVARFLQNKSPYRYFVDTKSIKIITRLEDNSGKNILEDDSRLRTVENLISRLIDPYGYIREDINLDKMPKNIDIKKCTILGNEFILISLEMAEFKEDTGTEYDQLIRNFAHKIKGKLGALQAAADQLMVQQGRVVDEDDVALVGIIQSATDSINNLVERLHKYSHAVSGGHSRFDVNQIIKQVANRMVNSSDAEVKLEMNLASKMDLMEGDEEQFESAIGELLDNAIKAGKPDGSIKINTLQKDENLFIRIENETFSPKQHSGYLNKTSFFEPFFSLDSDKAGMGLTIARRIINNHGGKIIADIGPDDIFRVEIELPISQKGVGDGS